MSGQPKKTLEEVRAIIDSIEFVDRKFRVEPLGGGFFLQVQYMEADINTGVMAQQNARKWYVSAHSTETEVVETAFKACRVSMDHVLKEHFTYKGRRVYSPHFDIKARLELCDAKRFDGRIPIGKEHLEGRDCFVCKKPGGEYYNADGVPYWVHPVSVGECYPKFVEWLSAMDAN
jgi:hypothetical protein